MSSRPTLHAKGRAPGGSSSLASAAGKTASSSAGGRKSGPMKSSGSAAKAAASADADLDGNFAAEAFGDPESDAAADEFAGSSSAATVTVPADAVTGKKRSRKEMEAAGAAPAGSKHAGPTGSSSSGKAAKAGAGGAGVGAEEEKTYKRVAAELLSQRSGSEQASKFWALFCASKCGEKLADAEISHPLQEAHISTGGAGAVTGALSHVEDLPDVLKGALPEWKSVFGWKHKADKRPPGAPAVIIVTYSAVRAASMLKPLGVFKTRIAKLFAKHLSLEEQRAILKGPPVTMAVGTPHRIAKLLEDGSLALSHAQLVLVDVHPDVKGYDILQHPNIKEDVFTLYRDHVHALVTAGKVKLAFY